MHTFSIQQVKNETLFLQNYMEEKRGSPAVVG
jgi:hypothetical protein